MRTNENMYSYFVEGAFVRSVGSDEQQTLSARAANHRPIRHRPHRGGYTVWRSGQRSLVAFIRVLSAEVGRLCARESSSNRLARSFRKTRARVVRTVGVLNSKYFCKIYNSCRSRCVRRARRLLALKSFSH